MYVHYFSPSTGHGAGRLIRQRGERVQVRAAGQIIDLARADVVAFRDRSPASYDGALVTHVRITTSWRGLRSCLRRLDADGRLVTETVDAARVIPLEAHPQAGDRLHRVIRDLCEPTEKSSHFELVDADGPLASFAAVDHRDRMFGTLTLVLPLTDDVATLDLLRFDGSERRGHGTRTVDRVATVLRAHGYRALDAVTTGPGMYFFARYGFEFTGGNAELARIVRSASSPIPRLVSEGRVSEGLVRSLMSQTNLMASELAAYGEAQRWIGADGRPTWLGREVLLHGRAWCGRLDLGATRGR